MKYDMTISQENNISDPLAMDQPEVVAGVLRIAEETVAAGKQVTLQYEFTNAPPQVIKVFRTVGEIQKWRSMLNEVQEHLERRPI
jgi:hypothetical protein